MSNIRVVYVRYVLSTFFYYSTPKITLNEIGDDDNHTAYMGLEETISSVWKEGSESSSSPKNGIELHLTSQLNDEKLEFSFAEIKILQVKSFHV